MDRELHVGERDILGTDAAGKVEPMNGEHGICYPPRRPFLAKGVKHIGLHTIVALQDDRVVTVRGAAEFGKVFVTDTIRAKSRKLRTKWSVSSEPDLLAHQDLRGV